MHENDIRRAEQQAARARIDNQRNSALNTCDRDMQRIGRQQVSTAAWFCSVFGLATIFSPFVVPETTAAFAIAAAIAVFCFLCTLYKNRLNLMSFTNDAGPEKRAA